MNHFDLQLSVAEKETGRCLLIMHDMKNRHLELVI
jgi:hypothetical protein